MLKDKRDQLFAHITENLRPSTSSSELYFTRLGMMRRSTGGK